MITVGVDGCRGGWVSADSQRGIQRFGGFADLVSYYAKEKDNVQLLVDMPMGLKQTTPRDVESKARERLRGRASSVFAVPCRLAVYAESYREACDINSRAFGRKLSKQVWNICPKIKEVDGFLRDHPGQCERIFECHPELTFSILAGGPLSFSKRTREGILERLTVLTDYLPEARSIYHQAVETTLRKHVGRDDILDAMALLACGQIGWDLLVDSEEADENGIPIRLAIPRLAAGKAGHLS